MRSGNKKPFAGVKEEEFIELQLLLEHVSPECWGYGMAGHGWKRTISAELGKLVFILSCFITLFKKYN